ncbi:hypothetical protein [Pedobacter yonginense]|uniref:hypothetical protein n=1 Tax=Pedobacter yonginense TaxID=651869 RepID=UPI001981B308|nr:hypothetical protein [Pedobacter yonginense]
MKIKALLFLATFPTLAFCQTGMRDNAGLMGNAGATSGFFQTFSPVNYPSGATGWWHLLDVRHTNNDNNYAMQFAGSFFDQNLYFRKTNDSATQPWSKVLTELNGSSGIGTSAPSSYFHGGNNKVLEVLNANSGMHSQAHLVLSTNSTLQGSSAGTLTWISKGSAQNQGLAYIAVCNALNSVTNASGNMYFATANTGAPEIKMTIDYTGNVGIGTTTPKEKLSVNGNIRAKEVKVETANWPDYVFEDGYKVSSLQQLETYIKTNKHLPEIPSAKEAETNGIDVGEMNKKLLQKVEELTLYLIQKDKEMVELKNQFLKEKEANQAQLDAINAKLRNK